MSSSLPALGHRLTRTCTRAVALLRVRLAESVLHHPPV
jgi:hypothetical protein